MIIGWLVIMYAPIPYYGKLLQTRKADCGLSLHVRNDSIVQREFEKRRMAERSDEFGNISWPDKMVTLNENEGT
jgi:hypothetical protein